MAGGISTEHVVVGQQMLEADALDGLGIRADTGRVGPNLGLWKHCA
jgi:hypothetical protein